MSSRISGFSTYTKLYHKIDLFNIFIDFINFTIDLFNIMFYYSAIGGAL